jgi:hypothetical protein
MHAKVVAAASHEIDSLNTFFLSSTAKDGNVPRIGAHLHEVVERELSVWLAAEGDHLRIS